MARKVPDKYWLHLFLLCSSKALQMYSLLCLVKENGGDWGGQERPSRTSPAHFRIQTTVISAHSLPALFASSRSCLFAIPSGKTGRQRTTTNSLTYSKSHTFKCLLVYNQLLSHKSAFCPECVPHLLPVAFPHSTPQRNRCSSFHFPAHQNNLAFPRIIIRFPV